jgi:hypothetical protein
MPATWKETDYARDTSRSLSNIGEDLVITGNVTSKGEIQLDGQLHGDIHCVSLILGENAQLEGGVVAEDVVIRGRLKGSVRALRVTLESKCHVEGDLIGLTTNRPMESSFPRASVSSPFAAPIRLMPPGDSERVTDGRNHAASYFPWPRRTPSASRARNNICRQYSGVVILRLCAATCAAAGKLWGTIMVT